jgi:GNAT superfamily N-acetyltransferase
MTTAHARGSAAPSAAPAAAPPFTVRVVDAGQARALIPALAEVLVECVDGGAGVSFVAPLARGTAEAFWRTVAEGVAAGDRVLLVAEDAATGALLGTVQAVFAWPENAPHRADVAKMLVRGAARRRGVGAALLGAVEAAAGAAGRTLLVLDTFTGSDAERLYERHGWTRVGVIPAYALTSGGSLGATTYFYKSLEVP